jgi:hypothetical protein
MIAQRSRRMTVAYLKERMDRRFKAVDQRFKAVDKRFNAVDARFDRLTARVDAGFVSVHEKLNAILHVLDDEYEHHREILNNHEERLKDLEADRRAR